MPNSRVHCHRPSHPNVIKVESGSEHLSARAVSLQTLPPGALLIKVIGSSPTTCRSYATLQASRDCDIDLNSDLAYCNHSCKPSVIFDTSTMEVRVVDDRVLREGDEITFFYPSTEWDMAQPFDCTCGAASCIGTVRGARYLNRETLRRYWLNAHIHELLAEHRDAEEPQGHDGH